MNANCASYPKVSLAPGFKNPTQQDSYHKSATPKKAPHLPISPRNAHEVVSPHPAFKQDLRLLAQTSQKMIVSDIGIIWLRKKCLPLPLAGPKIFLSISKTD